MHVASVSSQPSRSSYCPDVDCLIEEPSRTVGLQPWLTARQEGQYHLAVAGGSSDFRFAIADCQLAFSGRRQSEIGN
jgi:hypothetical protein